VTTSLWTPANSACNRTPGTVTAEFPANATTACSSPAAEPPPVAATAVPAVANDKPATKPNADAAAISRLVFLRERVTATFVSPGAVEFRHLCRHHARASVALSADTARSE
jgi:hypothetical protein